MVEISLKDEIVKEEIRRRNQTKKVLTVSENLRTFYRQKMYNSRSSVLMQLGKT